MATIAPTATLEEELADSLLDASASCVPIPPIRDRVPEADADAGSAYRIQEHLTQARLRAGRRLVGRKIGLTATSVQKQLGVDQPDFGMLFDHMSVPDGESVAMASLIAPKCEAEIAFVLGADIDVERPTIVDVLAAIDYALPAIEIVDSRIANWDIRFFDTVADNASSGLFVLGSRPVALDAFDLRLCGMLLTKNGEGVSYGAGAACLGHPLNALRWLAATMTSVGRPLRAGDVVLSGALGPMIAARAGDYYEACINGLGSVRVAFSGAAA